MRGEAVVLGAVLVAFLAGWVARQPAEAVPQVVVRWVRGPVRTVEVPDATCADPVSEDCAAQDRVAMALLALPDDVPLDPPATEAGCRARIALAAAMTTARQLEEVGRPEPFPPDLPEKYNEAVFTRVARSVAAACPEHDLRKVDCSEFPCMALFVGSTGASAHACSPWREEYGDGQTTSNGVLIGADGEELRYELVGPAVPEEFAPREPMRPDGRWGNGMVRLQQRGREAREAIIAELGARERTQAEEREAARRLWQDELDEGNEGARHILESLEKQWAAEDHQN